MRGFATGVGSKADIGARPVVTWEGPGEPIMLALYGPDGTTAVPLLPKRALTLAQELLTYMPDAARADFRTAPELIPEVGSAPGFDTV